MIHSMSGGVLADEEAYDFAKVRVEGEPRWYLARFPVQAGDRVLVPYLSGAAEGTVERVERCTAQTAPCSPRRAQEILRVLRENG